jgi:hypothetical protein
MSGSFDLAKHIRDRISVVWGIDMSGMPMAWMTGNSWILMFPI